MRSAMMRQVLLTVAEARTEARNPVWGTGIPSPPSPTPVPTASTSATSTAPAGPVPWIAARSFPCSAASLRALGEAGIRRVRLVVVDSPSMNRAPSINRAPSMNRGATAVTCPSVGVSPCAGPTSATAGSCGDSPGARIAAITCPTGISTPTAPVTLASTPEAGASISTVALSVSISTNGSPFATSSPSFLSQRSMVPVSCAMPSAGKMTCVAMKDLLLKQDGMPSPERTESLGFGLVTITVDIQLGLGFTRCGQRTVNGVIAYTCYKQFLRWKTGNDLAAILRNDQLLLDTSRRPTIAGRPEGLKGEDHTLLDHFWVVERYQAAENGFLPDGKPHAVTVLERKGGLFVGEAELFRFGPELNDLGGGHPRLDSVNGTVQDIPTVLIGVYLCLRGAAYNEGAVVAGAVAVITMQYIEIGWIARPQCTISIDVRMGAAAFAGNRIDAFDVL